MKMRVIKTGKCKELVLTHGSDCLTTNLLDEEDALELAQAFIRTAKDLLPDNKVGFRNVLKALGEEEKI